MEQNCGINLEVISIPSVLLGGYEAHMAASKYHTFCIITSP